MMALRSSYVMSDVRAGEKDLLAKMERAHTNAVTEWSEGLQQDLRDDVIASGLGERLARTWRQKAYPERGKTSLDPAGLVYVNPGKGGRGNAPTIIDFYSAARVIVPLIGEALALPTKDCPKTGASRGGKRFMSPLEVEARFNAELFPLRLKKGGMGLFIEVIPGLSTLKGGYRPTTKARIKAGRASKVVMMFVLRRNVKGRKRLNHPAIHRRWVAQFPALVAAHARLQGLE